MIDLKSKQYPSIILKFSFSAIFFLAGCNNIRLDTDNQLTNSNVVHSQEMNNTIKLLEELNVKLEYGINKTDYIIRTGFRIRYSQLISKGTRNNYQTLSA